MGRKISRTLVTKSRACSSRCCGLSSVAYHGWGGKCSEILAIPCYSKSPRVNKDMWYDMMMAFALISTAKVIYKSNELVWPESEFAETDLGLYMSLSKGFTSLVHQRPALSNFFILRLCHSFLNGTFYDSTEMSNFLELRRFFFSEWTGGWRALPRPLAARAWVFSVLEMQRSSHNDSKKILAGVPWRCIVLK